MAANLVLSYMNWTHVVVMLWYILCEKIIWNMTYVQCARSLGSHTHYTSYQLVCSYYLNVLENRLLCLWRIRMMYPVSTLINHVNKIIQLTGYFDRVSRDMQLRESSKLSLHYSIHSISNLMNLLVFYCLWGFVL